jgi:hypothetical protein
LGNDEEDSKGNDSQRRIEMKTLKSFLAVHGIETISSYDSDGPIEVLFVQNSHGPFDRDGDKYDRYDFCVWRNKVLVRKGNVGVFQCQYIPWKGEQPEEMYFKFEYIG